MMNVLYLLAQILGSPDDVGLPDVEASESLVRTAIIPAIAVVTAVISVIFIILGGFRYIVGAGAPEQMQQAKNTILYAVVGLIVSIFAIVIVRFVVNSVQ